MPKRPGLEAARGVTWPGVAEVRRSLAPTRPYSCVRYGSPPHVARFQGVRLAAVCLPVRPLAIPDAPGYNAERVSMRRDASRRDRIVRLHGSGCAVDAHVVPNEHMSRYRAELPGGS